MLTLLLSRLEAGKPVLEEREKTQRLVPPVMRLIVCLCEDRHKINYVSRIGQPLFRPPHLSRPNDKTHNQTIFVQVSRIPTFWTLV